MNSKPIDTVVVKSIFTQDEYSLIYDKINGLLKKGEEEQSDKYYFMKKLVNNGFIVHFEEFDELVLSRVKEMFEKASGVEVNKPNVLFCRYTHDSGSRPQLQPHIDRVMNTLNFTTTIELDTTLDWDIYIEHEKVNLDKNDAVIFCGTSNIHWRPDIDFSDNDYFDVLLCHAEPKTDAFYVEEDFHDKQEARASEFQEKYRHLLEKSLTDPPLGVCQ